MFLRLVFDSGCVFVEEFVLRLHYFRKPCVVMDRPARTREVREKKMKRERQ